MLGKIVFNIACLVMLLIGVAFMPGLINELTSPKFGRVNYTPPVALPGPHIAQRRGRPVQPGPTAAQVETPAGQKSAAETPPNASADAPDERVPLMRKLLEGKQRRSREARSAEMPAQNTDGAEVKIQPTERVESSQPGLDK